MESKRIGIIGAGFGGMTAALDLVKAGYDVTIFEGTGGPGGLAAGFKEPEWEWSVENFYHHWFTSDAHMFRLFKELGVEKKVLVRHPTTVVYYKGKFYPFDSILAALLYPGLGFGIRQDPFWSGGVVPAPDKQLETDGKNHGRCVDAQMGWRKGLPQYVGTDDRWQIQRKIRQGRQHVLDVGALSCAFNQPGDL